MFIHQQNGAATAASNVNRCNLSDFSTLAPAATTQSAACDGVIRMVGDSMYPILMNGDIVLYKMLKNNTKPPLFGGVYIVSFDVDDDTQTIIGYLYQSDLPRHYKIVSENPSFGAKDIPVDTVRNLAIINGSFRCI